MNTGKIKFFNETKGFGFITPEDGSADVFVHVSALKNQVTEGDVVTYDVERTPKGINATNVKLA
ncbi:cold-shock protein [Sphingobacterium thalpophilum]|uniref:Cold shock domain-containing protein n=1 Tax=Sphingobacterium thalpophilum TaxID=259 RepID=A0A4U9W3Z1_9SPHI|nr:MULTISPECIES: cold shock domain-containing protein [Sphingobacterium]MCW8311481.1 cold shock domain-containing protein [Sphingobacterium sp. InxBP1]VTR53435.1 Cold shock-like protein CspE [Sphingobacterium thalpophilum]